MKSINLFFLGFLLVTTACSSDYPINPQPTTITPKQHRFFTNQNEAIKIADDARKKYFGDETRSSIGRKIELISKHPSRSAEEEGMYYIINYGENEGFAVISADKRVSSLQAISDTGSLSITDTIQNKNLAFFFDNLEMQYSGLPTPGPGTGPGTTPIDTLTPFPVIPIRNTVTVRPLLATAVRQWHQYYPYNIYCPMVQRPQSMPENPAVGCVGISTAQILSYYKYPNTIDVLNLDWDLITTTPQNNLTSSLLAKIGEAQFLNLDYGIPNTGGSSDRAYYTYYALGYNYPSVMNPFSEFRAKSILTSRSPIQVFGTNNQTGHAWIIDGLIYTERQDLETPGGWAFEIQYLFHCVWGSNGNGDGYYSLNINGEFGGSPVETDPNDNPGTATYFGNLFGFYNFK